MYRTLPLRGQFGENRAERRGFPRISHRVASQFVVARYGACAGHAPGHDRGERGAVVLGQPLHPGPGALVDPGVVGFGEAPEQPRVPEGLAGGEARRRVPVQALLDEVSKGGVLAALQRRTPLLAAGRAPQLATARAGPGQQGGAGGQSGDATVARVALGVDEALDALGVLQDLLRRHAQQLHDAGQLVGLVLAGEQRVAGQQLGQDAAEAPHVDGETVARTQDHLWGSVEAGLDVGVDTLVLEAAGAKVDHLGEKFEGGEKKMR